MSRAQSPNPLFNLAEIFEVDDYLFVYGDDLDEIRSTAEVALWVKLLELKSPLKILDLACGFGRHANRLAALGHVVTGMDLMPGFLEIAKQQAQELGVQVDYHQGDMREMDFVSEFDRVLMLFTSFGYFSDQQNLSVLRNIARALKPGGLLGLDMINRETMEKTLPIESVTERGKDLIINRLSFDAPTGILHNRRILIQNGVRKDKPHSIRLYTVAEIHDLLAQADLEVYRMAGSDGKPLTAASRRLLVVARRSAKDLR